MKRGGGTRREENWMENYAALKAFIARCGHLPDKRKVENRGLLNWWKYNRKRVAAGLMDAERLRLFSELEAMRTCGGGGLFGGLPR